jgi:hypothetical protein
MLLSSCLVVSALVLTSISAAPPNTVPSPAILAIAARLEDAEKQGRSLSDLEKRGIVCDVLKIGCNEAQRANTDSSGYAPWKKGCPDPWTWVRPADVSVDTRVVITHTCCPFSYCSHSQVMSRNTSRQRNRLSRPAGPLTLPRFLSRNHLALPSSLWQSQVVAIVQCWLGPEVLFFQIIPLGALGISRRCARMRQG